MVVAPKTAADDIRDGVICALISYLMWGVLPIYFKVVGEVAPVEVLLHRVVWAVPFGAFIVLVRRQGGEVWSALTNPRMLGFLTISAIMIAINWFIYIVAVQEDQIFQASLGYYINPLMYVVVGVVFLGEKLRRFQMIAVGLATIGVLVLTFSGGQFPWIALSLAVLFTIYGVIRKQIDIGGMPGLFVETIVLFPLAAGYWIWLAKSGGAAFSSAQPGLAALLMLAGPLTVLPLLFFALAARRLPLSLIGFLQFIAPTLQFLTGLYYGEVLTTAHILCFGLIWTAVAFFITDAWHQSVNSANQPPRDLQ